MYSSTNKTLHAHHTAVFGQMHVRVGFWVGQYMLRGESFTP